MRKLLSVLAMAAVLTAMSSCSGDDDNDSSVNLRDQMVYVGDSVSIGVAAKSNNEFVADVSGHGFLSGNHVGETTINYKGKTANVSVRGHYHTLDGVITEWGLTPDEVKSKQTSGKLDRTTTLNNGQYAMLFTGVGTANGVIYGFNNNKLFMAVAMSRITDSYDVTKYVVERYFVLPEKQENGSYYGINAYDPDLASTIVTISTDMDNKAAYQFVVNFISKDANVNLSSGAKRGLLMNSFNETD